MSYKYFIMYFFFGTILVLVVQPILFFFNLGAPDSRTQYIYDWVQLKQHIPRNISDNKVILLSGSNTLFGLDSKIIGNDLGISVVNMGIHAGLQEYIFYAVKPSLKSGDVLLLPLEYSYYRLSSSIEGEGLNYVVHRDELYVYSRPCLERIKMIYSCNMLDLLRGAKEKIIGFVVPKGSYSIDNLDEYGNIRSNIIENSIMLPPSKYRPLFNDDFVPNERSKLVLHEFLIWCRENDIKVYVTWPSYLCYGQKFSDNDRRCIENIKQFWQSENIEIIGNPEDSLYEAKYFFDTTYHLNDVGREIRTKKLLDELYENTSFMEDMKRIRSS